MLQRVAEDFDDSESEPVEKVRRKYRLVVLLNVKAVPTHQELRDSASGVLDEFRDIDWLYLQNRLGTSMSGKRGIP